MVYIVQAPFYKAVVVVWGSTFSKLMDMGVQKFLLEKGEVRQNGGRWCLEMGVAILYWGFSGDSSWFSIGTKSQCVYPLLTNITK